MLFLVCVMAPITGDAADQLCRVPDPSPSRQICVLHVLVHWTRRLYDTRALSIGNDIG
jgi:hypothetical protein